MVFKRKWAAKRKFVKRAPVRPRSRAMPRRSLTALIRRTVLRRAEPKTTRYNYGKIELNHNSFPPAMPLLNSQVVMPTQGPGDNQRIGDQINATRITLRMLIGQKGDRPNVTFRYLVIKVAKGSTLSYANVFHSFTFNVLLDDVNTDFCKILQTGTWRPNEAGLAATGNDEYTFVKQLIIPYKRTIKFGPADAAITHNDDDVYFILMAYDAFGSLTTDNIAYMQPSVTFDYRDP